MKDLKSFLDKKQTVNRLSNVYGGVMRDTGAPTKNGYEDTWNDANNDGKLSNGEYFIINS